MATDEMVVYCFDVLLCHHKALDPPEPDFSTSESHPFFVTWEKMDRHFRLRGCIGTLHPQPLHGLKDFTYKSALKDRRFSPITEEEVPHLRCSVSLLLHYEDINDCMDWVVGVHGVTISFRHRGESYSATYLPEVASEQGWSQQEAIHSLVQKAGYSGKVSPEFFSEIQATRYQSSKATLTFGEYSQLKAG